MPATVTVSTPQYTISGRISDKFNVPMSGLIVEAFDKRMRTDLSLSVPGNPLTTTDASGFYKITFTYFSFSGLEYKTPDVFIRVKDNQGKLLGESDVYFNIQTDKTIDLQIDPADEFTRLLLIIQPIAAGAGVTNIKDLEENEKHKDISFLAAETGISADKISAFVRAHQLAYEADLKLTASNTVVSSGSTVRVTISSTTNFSPSFFYALLHEGFSNELNILLGTDGKEVQKAIATAIKENIVPASTDDNLDNILKSFRLMLSHEVIEGQDAANEEFKSVISKPLPDTAMQKKFVQVYAATATEPEKFWDKLAEEPEFADGKAIEETKQVLRLNMLTGNQPELTKTLYDKQQADSSLKEMSGFAQFTKDDWKNFIAESNIINFPEGITGSTDEEKTEQYAASLENLMQMLYPVDFFSTRLKKDTSPHWSSLKSQLMSFLENNKKFKLKTSNIKNELAAANFSGISDKTAVEAEMKNINRLYKLSDKQEHVSALRNAGVGSAVELVSKFTPIQFAKQFAPTFGSEEAAKEFYKKAKSIGNKATAIVHNIRSTFAPDNPDVMKRALPQNEANDVFKELFNPDGLCECEHCMSVYSPAAYFVDVLKYLRDYGKPVNNTTVENQYYSTAFKNLLTGDLNLHLEPRRPDLQYINLTCKNTNTPVPYIDLVNELLEYEVWSKQASLSDDNKENALKSLQTNGEANEIAAIPEHINADVYNNQLKSASGNAILSPDLPLNLPLEELRLYLDKLGYERHELMELLYGKKEPGKYNDTTIAAEYLQFTPGETDILKRNDSFGIDVPGTIAELIQVLGISYVELLQLLETRFLNPINEAGRVLSIEAISDDPNNAATCDLNELKLNGGNSLWMDKTIRFIRFWRKIGWHVFDLDIFLMSLFDDDATKDFSDFETNILLPISHVARIQERLNLPVRYALTFRAEIDTFTYHDHSLEEQPAVPTVYEKLFQNKQVTNPVDADFNLPSNPVDPSEWPDILLTEKSKTIIAALNLSDADFELLRISFTDNKLNLKNLSTVFRYTTLAKAVRISISDLISIVDIIGINPFTNMQSDQTLLFLDTFSFIRSSGYSVNELSVLSGNAADTTGNAPDAKTIANLFASLRDGLKKNKLNFLNDADPVNRLQSQTNFIVDTLSIAFKTDSKLISVLINDVVKSTANNTSSAITVFIDDTFINSEEPLFSINDAGEVTWLFPDLYSTYINLSDTWKRISGLMTKFKVSTDEAIYFLIEQETLNIDGIWNLPTDNVNGLYVSLQNLCNLVRFRNALMKPGGDWYKLFDFAGNGDKRSYIISFVELTAIDQSTVEYLTGADANENGALNFNFPDDFRNGACLLNIIQCAGLSISLGSTVQNLFELIKVEADSNDAAIAKSILKSKYDEQQWLNIIKPISDQLRVWRRDALVAYLIASDDNAWYTPNDIYASLLIDTEMDACMMTSRIKQAISSVQLFIDRCLMGLEEGILLDDDFATQWNKWRERYRIWEANRKIFLYPENWIEPELRDDKSPFFKELESKLLQNEVTQETAQDAIMEYLQKLDEVANLEVAGIYQETFNDHDSEHENGLANIIHVIGRTPDVPHKYFYRKQINKKNIVNPQEQNGIWTPWERVELDIEGDHIIPVVWNKRLMLYWGIFTEKQDHDENFKVPGPHETIYSKPKYWAVKMAFSEYKNGRWSSKKMTKEKRLNWNYGYDPINKEDIVIRLIPASFIQFKIYHANVSSLIEGETFFDEQIIQALPNNATARMISGEVGPVNFQPLQPTYCSPPGTLFNNMKIVEDGLDTLALTKKNIIEYRQSLKKVLTANKETLFATTPGNFNITPSNIETRTLSEEPFAYKDNNGAFIVKNSVVSVDLQVVDPVSPSTYIKHYNFQMFYFPFANDLIQILNTKGIDGLYQKDVQGIADEMIFSEFNYVPDETIIDPPYPVKNYDFSLTGAYSIYNWELFFHIPLLIANRLNQNQKFEDAINWLHYIFNPTVALNGEGVQRFWVTRPFAELTAEEIITIEDILDPDKNHDLQKQVDYWDYNPFKPHAVARMRTSAYMRKTLMAYINNLVAWGDNLFRQNTLETINEATLLYVLATNILGRKPEKIPPRSIPHVYAFSNLQDLDPFSNAKVLIESFILPSATSDENAIGDLFMPLFCVPKNEELLSYWDTVEDRLFKIRHCQNIEGVFQQLPLFEPPIDPGLLVRAAGAGLDIASIINEGYLSLPSYRFNVMLAKANELCNDVKVLGNALLAALEKKDAEELSLIRSGQEIGILQAMRDIKKNQRDEAEENLNSLNKSKDAIEFRKEYYLSRTYKNSSEKEHTDSINAASIFQDIQSGNEVLASVLFGLPDVTIGAWSWGTTKGGKNLAGISKSISASMGALASFHISKGNLASIEGGFQRRQDDWKFQGQSSDLELKQVDKQIIAAEIRLAIAERDLEIHEQQIENTKATDDFMRSKFTNQELYSWMVDQVSGIYFQSYQLAYDTAKKAEKCFQYELGTEGTNYIQYGYWDSLKKGLLSAERLQYDLRRLENAYLEQNKREFEITKHISLANLNANAILEIRKKGACDFQIPEFLFEMDFPGHYFRRIKSVGVSIPCIAGPYTPISSQLSLNRSFVRTSDNDGAVAFDLFNLPNIPDSYREGYCRVKAIATSNAQGDTGMFEFNFRDERYLPFEGAGVISEWNLELPTEARQFDYNSISDVIITVRYTAKESTNPSFKNDVNIRIRETITASVDLLNSHGGLYGLLSLKNDFPDEFYRMKSDSSTVPVTKEFRIGKMFFPFFTGNYDIIFKGCRFYKKDGSEIPSLTVTNGAEETIDDNWKLFLSYNPSDLKNEDDVYLLVNYSLT